VAFGFSTWSLGFWICFGFGSIWIWDLFCGYWLILGVGWIVGKGEEGEKRLIKGIKKSLKSLIRRFRPPVSFLFIFILFLFGEASFGLYIIGLLLVLGGGLIRLWASGYIFKEEYLAREGPYAYCRNPLYLGSLLIGLGFCLISGILLSIFFLLFLFLLFYYPTILSEERDLKEKFGGEYKDYCREIPCFIPKMTIEIFVAPTFCLPAVIRRRLQDRQAHRRGGGNFSWRQSFKNREPASLLGILLMSLSFLFTGGKGLGIFVFQMVK